MRRSYRAAPAVAAHAQSKHAPMPQHAQLGEIPRAGTAFTHPGAEPHLAGLPGYPEATGLRRVLMRLAVAGRDALLKLHDPRRARMAAQSGRVRFALDSYQALVTNLELRPLNLWRFDKIAAALLKTPASSGSTLARSNEHETPEAPIFTQDSG